MRPFVRRVAITHPSTVRPSSSRMSSGNRPRRATRRAIQRMARAWANFRRRAPIEVDRGGFAPARACPPLDESGPHDRPRDGHFAQPACELGTLGRGTCRAAGGEHRVLNRPNRRPGPAASHDATPEPPTDVRLEALEQLADRSRRLPRSRTACRSSDIPPSASAHRDAKVTECGYFSSVWNASSSDFGNGSEADACGEGLKTLRRAAADRVYPSPEPGPLANLIRVIVLNLSPPREGP